MRFTRHARWFAIAALCSAPAALQAQAFGLNEIGSCSVGRTGSLTGAPCADASTIYWNPGATVDLPGGFSMLAGAAPIHVTGGFTHDTTGRFESAKVPMVVAPHLFISYHPRTGSLARTAWGVGVYVPYGLTSQWPTDFSGRFSAYKAAIATMYIQPNVAFDLVPGKLSIGGGPIIGHSTVELRQSLDLAAQQAVPGMTFAQLGFQSGTEFGRAKLTADDWAYGFTVGVHGRFTPSLEWGARYLSELKFDYVGDATFTQVPTNLVIGPIGPIPAGTSVDQLVAPVFSGALRDQTGKTSLPHPAQVQVGLGWKLLPNTKLSVDYAFINWSKFKSLPIDFANDTLDAVLLEDYKNSNAIRTSLDQSYASGWGARAGFSFATTPAPDETVTPLLPDMNRYNFALGVSTPTWRGMSLDGSYLRVETQGRRGRIGGRTAGQTAAEVNSGFYTLNADIFSISLKASF